MFRKPFFPTFSFTEPKENPSFHAFVFFILLVFLLMHVYNYICSCCHGDSGLELWDGCYHFLSLKHAVQLSCREWWLSMLYCLWIKIFLKIPLWLSAFSQYIILTFIMELKIQHPKFLNLNPTVVFIILFCLVRWHLFSQTTQHFLLKYMTSSGNRYTV